MAILFENRGTQTGTFHGPLPWFNDDARVIRYRMDDGPETVARKEVSGDVGGVNVDPVTDTNHPPVLWTANLDSSRDDVRMVPGERFNWPLTALVFPCQALLTGCSLQKPFHFGYLSIIRKVFNHKACLPGYPAQAFQKRGVVKHALSGRHFIQVN